MSAEVAPIEGPFRAMVLCAGLGTRLRPLTDHLPKPLVPVGDRPVLAHIADALAAAGFASALINTHWHEDKLRDYSGACPIALKLLHEVEVRGVAGGIAGARSLLSPPVVAWNGDIVMQAPPLARLLERAEERDICLAVAETSGPGTVGLDAEGSVVRLRGASFGREVRAADYVGLSAIGSGALVELPSRGCLVGDYLLPRLAAGRSVPTVIARGAWFDVGSLEGYRRANRAWLDARADRDARGFVHPTAAVAREVTLERCIVGRGARVRGRGRLSDCIVWPDAEAVAPASNAVITPHGVVSLGRRS